MGVVDHPTRRQPPGEQSRDSAILLREASACAPVQDNDPTGRAVEAQHESPLVLLGALAHEPSQQAAVLIPAVAAGNGGVLESAVAGVEEQRPAGVGTDCIA
jgi:hypothetical protein